VKDVGFSRPPLKERHRKRMRKAGRANAKGPRRRWARGPLLVPWRAKTHHFSGPPLGGARIATPRMVWLTPGSPPFHVTHEEQCRSRASNGCLQSFDRIRILRTSPPQPSAAELCVQTRQNRRAQVKQSNSRSHRLEVSCVQSTSSRPVLLRRGHFLRPPSAFAL
jgi:hypothetical protein